MGRRFLRENMRAILPATGSTLNRIDHLATSVPRASYAQVSTVR
ncbi:hypothetical protein F750_3163 [Streptomyces sp. PAMC 26508]|nr:hypothetical protein F750_3163 [Streptomyces sp. PAMC 26508]